MSHYTLKVVLKPIFMSRRALAKYVNFIILLANRKDLLAIFSTWQFMPKNRVFVIFQKMSILEIQFIFLELATRVLGFLKVSQ